jgi:hypothetical protein
VARTHFKVVKLWREETRGEVWDESDDCCSSVKGTALTTFSPEVRRKGGEIGEARSKLCAAFHLQGHLRKFVFPVIFSPADPIFSEEVLKAGWWKLGQLLTCFPVAPSSSFRCLVLAACLLQCCQQLGPSLLR